MPQTAATPPISPRKAPRQARSQATVTAILDATARILVEQGYAAANTNAVAGRAGVSVGSLYQYFPSKDALIHALKVRHGEQMMAVIQRALQHAMGLTLAEAIAGLVEATVEAHRVDADLHRVLEEQVGTLQGEALPEEYVELMKSRIVELLARHRSEIVVPDLRLAAFMLMQAAHPLIHAVVRERPRGVSLRQGSQEIVRMMTRYLTAPQVEAREPRPRAA